MDRGSGPTAARVLVAEDDADTRAAIAAALEELDVVVLTAADGAEALRCAQEERPDLVLLDIGLPGMSGLDVARALKADPATVAAAIPVVAISALVRFADAGSANAHGLDAFVPKPFAVDHLVALVRAWLGRDGGP